VQKVQPNDKFGKLLPNNHTQGRKRAPGHLKRVGGGREARGNETRNHGAGVISALWPTVSVKNVRVEGRRASD
jgi:hypothetical protein